MIKVIINTASWIASLSFITKVIIQLILEFRRTGKFIIGSGQNESIDLFLYYSHEVEEKYEKLKFLCNLFYYIFLLTIFVLLIIGIVKFSTYV